MKRSAAGSMDVAHGSSPTHTLGSESIRCFVEGRYDVLPYAAERRTLCPALGEALVDRAIIARR